MKRILVTGAAGFIGAHLVQALLRTGLPVEIIGIDNLNNYYDVSLKEYRLAEIEKAAGHGPRWRFIKGAIDDRTTVDRLFSDYAPDVVVNLAAQAGVRHSISHPDDYIRSNIIGFYNILEACRHSYDDSGKGVRHLVFASSSSIYGHNTKTSYSTDDNTDSPISLYAATKKSNELMAYAYSHLYHIPATGLRFFSVYGPAGRPDMACFLFADKWRRGETIEVNNYGQSTRDFTYIDDIVKGIKLVMQKPPCPKAGPDGQTPFAVYNIGNGSPVKLLDFIEILQDELAKAKVLPGDFDFNAHRKPVPLPPGDVPDTNADTRALERDFGFRPETGIREGLHRFVKWYKEFYLE